MRGLEENPLCSARFWLRRAINTNPADLPNPKLEESKMSLEIQSLSLALLAQLFSQCIHERETLLVDKLEPWQDTMHISGES